MMQGFVTEAIPNIRVNSSFKQSVYDAPAQSVSSANHRGRDESLAGLEQHHSAIKGVL